MEFFFWGVGGGWGLASVLRQVNRHLDGVASIFSISSIPPNIMKVEFGKFKSI